jgi:hypothetical protein
MYLPVSGWEKTTKAINNEESGVMFVTDRKVIASYNLNHTFWFTEDKPVIVGKIISAFALVWLISGWDQVVWMGGVWRLRILPTRPGIVCRRRLMINFFWGVSCLISQFACSKTLRLGFRTSISIWIPSS